MAIVSLTSDDLPRDRDAVQALGLVPDPILKGYEWVPGAQCAAYEEGVAEMHAEFTEDTEGEDVRMVVRFTRRVMLSVRAIFSQPFASVLSVFSVAAFNCRI